MPSAGSCRVCARADVAEIDALLAAGDSPGAIARDREIPRSTIRVHWSRCRKGGKALSPAKAPPSVLPAALALPAVELPADHPVAPLLQQLAEIHGPALESYKLAVLAGNVNQQILLLPQLRNNLKTQESMLAKIEQPKDETERLLGHPDFAETALCLARALDAFPEARAAYVAELERLCGEEVQ